MRIASFLALLDVLAREALARAGGGGGFHGGGHSGGSYSGGGTGITIDLSSSGGSSRGGGWLESIIDLYFQLLVTHPRYTIAATIFGIWLLSRFITFNRAIPFPDKTERQDPTALQTQSLEARQAALSAILTRDPAFNEAAFLQRVSAAFLVIQEAWSAQDMAKARPFVSDGVLERFRRQLAEQKARGVRNQMEEVTVLNADVLGYVAGPHFDAAYVGLSASARDRTVKLGTDKVVADDSGPFQEIWTFLRRPGAQTLARPGLLEGNCPSCGAPLAIADAAQCSACKAWVNSGEHDWVLVMITQSSVWSFPAAFDVVGWGAMSARDPELSLEALEDLTSRAFWRWMDARRRGDTAPLRGISAPELLSQDGLLPGSVAVDAAVGLVQAAAFETRAGFDRAHVKVRWEAEFVDLGSGSSEGRDQHEHFFVFKRKAGATSAIKAGLSSGRCPSCGAPSEEADAQACLYCKRPFNDGTVSWVLSEIVAEGEWRRPRSAGAD